MTPVDLYKRGCDYFEQKRWANAIRFFTRAIKKDPVFTEAYIKRGRAYCKQGEGLYSRAMRDFNKAIRLKPDDDRAYCARGKAYFLQGRHLKAISDYNRALRIEPEQYGLYIARAQCYLCEERGGQTPGEGEATEDTFLAAEDFETEAESFEEPGQDDSGEERPIQPSQAGPDLQVTIDPDSYINKAWMDGRGADRAALEDFSRAILIEPGFGYAFWCRGNIYLEHAFFDTAIVEYTEAIRLVNDDIPDPYYQRAQAYHGKGWLEQSLRDYNQAISRDGSRGEFFWCRGVLWESKGDLDKAREDFETAQRLGYCKEEEDD